MSKANQLNSQQLLHEVPRILALDRPHVTKQDPKEAGHVIHILCINDSCYTYGRKLERDQDYSSIKKLIKINKETDIKLY